VLGAWEFLNDPSTKHYAPSTNKEPGTAQNLL